jgi:hypothetical protein
VRLPVCSAFTPGSIIFEVRQEQKLGNEFEDEL